jgi:hypothetical protein
MKSLKLLIPISYPANTSYSTAKKSSEKIKAPQSTASWKQTFLTQVTTPKKPPQAANSDLTNTINTTQLPRVVNLQLYLVTIITLKQRTVYFILN